MNQEDRTTALNLIESQKIDLKRRISSGETGLFDEYDRLVSIESGLLEEEFSENSEGADEEIDPILKRMQVKRPRRHYTMSPAALEQRRAAAAHSTGPVTEEGKANSSKNGWKHGRHARSRVLGIGKPCRTTCRQYPCALVDDGATQPGGDCLDKAYFLDCINTVSSALKNGDITDLKDHISLQLAGSLSVIEELQASILEHGVYFKSEKIDKTGKVIGYDMKPNPSLLPLSNLLKAVGVTLPDFNLTPAALSKVKADKEVAETLADIFRGAGAAMAAAKEKKGP